MNGLGTKQLHRIICCPFCNGELEWTNSLKCLNCGDKYEINLKTGQIDLRLRRPKLITLKQEINNTSNAFNHASNLGVYEFKFGYKKNLHGPNYNTIEKMNRKPVGKLYSWLPKGGGVAIDIGSEKDNKNKAYLEMAGFAYISVDYDSPDAMILADAHSLPFKNNSINCITNLALMEHVEFPYIAGREFYRCLKPDGKLLGVVAFLQQFHMSSWYHFTHYGVYSWLINSGFNAENIMIDAADKKYHGIYNTASLIGLPKWLINLLLNPIYYIHRFLWWIYKVKTGDDMENQRHLQTTGAIHFIADKYI